MKAIIYFVIMIFPVCINAQIQVTIDQIIYDQLGEPYRTDIYFGIPWAAHEGLLHGIPTYWDWYHGSRPGLWMNKGSNKALTSWGQVYEWRENSPVTNVRFQIRNHGMYVYTGAAWEIADSIAFGIECYLYNEDYSGSPQFQFGRDESNNGGGSSYTISPGKILHWWSDRWPRYEIPNSFEAAFIRCEIRLIPNTDSAVAIDEARYLAAVSADYYPEIYSIGSAPALTMPRHRFLTSEWQVFTTYVSGNIPQSEQNYLVEILSRPLPPFVNEGSFGTESYNERKKEIMIYPNPSVDKVNIKIPFGFGNIRTKLFDSKGTCIVEHSNSTSIDISTLRRGIYFLHVFTDAKYSVFKVIIE
jgi:hypothetical protein